jgi:hypothetical protein
MCGNECYSIEIRKIDNNVELRRSLWFFLTMCCIIVMLGTCVDDVA